MDHPTIDTEVVKSAILGALREKIRRSLFSTTAECLGSPDAVVLQALGIDAREKLLQIFVEEINSILAEEGANGE